MDNKFNYTFEIATNVNDICHVSGWFFHEKKIKSLEVYENTKIISVSKDFTNRPDVKKNFKSDINSFGFNLFFYSKKENFLFKFNFTDYSFINVKLTIKRSNRGDLFNRMDTFFSNLRLLLNLTLLYLKRNNFKIKHPHELLVKAINVLKNTNTSLSINSSKTNILTNKLNFVFNQSLKKKLIDDANNLSNDLLFSLITPVYNPPLSYLSDIINSLNNQIVNNFEIIFIDNSSNSEVKKYLQVLDKKYKFVKIKFLNKNYGISFANNVAIKMARGRYVGFLDHDDILTDDALYLFTHEINKNPNLQIIYSDEAKVSNNLNEIIEIHAKPAFSPELLLSTNYIQHLFFVTKKLAKSNLFSEDIKGSQDYDFLLRITKNIDISNIGHIPKVLYFWRSNPNSIAQSLKNKDYISHNATLSLQKYLTKNNLNAKAVLNKDALRKGMVINNIKWNTFYDLASNVTIVIPNRNSPNLIKQCLGNLSKYNKLGIPVLIIDDDSDDPLTFQTYDSFLKNHNYIKLIKYKRRENIFNYASLINYSLKYVKTKFFLQLNNDVEFDNLDWINQMYGWFSFKNIQVVGANLFFKNKKIQHSGVFIGAHGGLADHIFKGSDFFDNLFFGFQFCSRNVSAVTGACLMTDTKLFKQLGSYDDNKFKVQYNDVDYCLRVIQRKKQIVVDPIVSLIHPESTSRKKNYDIQEHLNFLDKYPNYQDNFYNSNFSKDFNNFSLSNTNFYYTKKTSINILMVLHDLSLTGAPIVGFNQAKYLKDCGNDVTIISPKYGPLSKDIKKSKIELIIFNFNDTLFLKDGLLKNENSDSVLDIRKYDSVIFNSLASKWDYIDLFDPIKSKFLNVHESISLHDCFKSLNHKYKDSQKNTIKTLIKFNSIIFQSKNSMNIFDPTNLLNNKLLIPGSLPYEKIRKFIANNDKNKLRLKYNFDIKDFLISNIGTVCQRKGQDIFIKAALKILKNNTNFVNVKFLIVGDNDSTYSEYIKKDIPNKYYDHFIFIKETNDIYDYYLLSDLFVCTSYQESFPMVVLLAMAFDLPIISTNVNGIPEMISSDNSMLYYPGDIESLRRNIDLLVKSDILRKNLTLNAKSFFLRNFKDSIRMHQFEEQLKLSIFNI